MSENSSALRTVEDLDVVFDADAHLMESLEHVLEYMDNDAVRDDIERASHPRYMIYNMATGGPIADYYGDENPAQEGAGVSLLGKKEEEMADFDLDYALAGPTLNLGLSTVYNDRHAVEIMQAYDRWMLDNVADADVDWLLPTLTVAPQVPDRAAEEIDEHGDDVVGVHVPPSGLAPPLGHDRYDPIYEAAAAKDLPLIFHPGASTTDFPVQMGHVQNHAEWHVWGFPFTNVWTLVSLVFNGALERHPDATFLFQEAGIGWVPYVKYRMDDHYLTEAEVLPYLDRLPSRYVDDQMYFATQPLGHAADHPEHIAQFIEMAGPGSVLYASDLPHYDFDPPSELFDRVVSHLDDEDVRALMGGNGRDLFGV